MAQRLEGAGLTEVRLGENSVPINNGARVVCGICIYATETDPQYFPHLTLSGKTETVYAERATTKMTAAENYFGGLNRRCDYEIRASRGYYSKRTFVAI